MGEGRKKEEQKTPCCFISVFFTLAASLCMLIAFSYYLNFNSGYNECWASPYGDQGNEVAYYSELDCINQNEDTAYAYRADCYDLVNVS